MKTLNRTLDLELKDTIKTIPDFPKPGILFRDITPILKNGELFGRTIRHFADRYRVNKPDAIVCIESRGFLLGAPLAVQLGVGLVLVRKRGKLPRKTCKVSYQLEYGVDELETHEEDLVDIENVLIVDDVLATGGTTSAVVQLIEGLRCRIIEISFLIELMGLEGRNRLKKHPVFSLVKY